MGKKNLKFDKYNKDIRFTSKPGNHYTHGFRDYKEQPNTNTAGAYKGNYKGNNFDPNYNRFSQNYNNHETYNRERGRNNYKNSPDRRKRYSNDRYPRRSP